MELVVKDLRLIQESLDARIFDLHNTTRERTRNDRILALLVELGELANETRCFKYWSLKGPSEDAIVFEEFSDVLHFTLSLGIDIKDADDSIHYDTSSLTLNEQFHNIYHLVHEFSKSNAGDDYRLLFKAILTLAQSMGMTDSKIRSMYLDKNSKNHQRQDNQY